MRSSFQDPELAISLPPNQPAWFFFHVCRVCQFFHCFRSPIFALSRPRNRRLRAVHPASRSHTKPSTCDRAQTVPPVFRFPRPIFALLRRTNWTLRCSVWPREGFVTALPVSASHICSVLFSAPEISVRSVLMDTYMSWTFRTFHLSPWV